MSKMYYYVIFIASIIVILSFGITSKYGCQNIDTYRNEGKKDSYQGTSSSVIKSNKPFEDNFPTYVPGQIVIKIRERKQRDFEITLLPKLLKYVPDLKVERVFKNIKKNDRKALEIGLSRIFLVSSKQIQRRYSKLMSMNDRQFQFDKDFIDQDSLRLLLILQKEENLLEYVHLNRVKYPNIIITPGVDAHFNVMWHLHNTGQEYPKKDGTFESGTAGVDINAPEGWDIDSSNRAEGITVAVIDTGIDYNHEDMEENVWINPGEDLNNDGHISPNEENGRDDDNNGYTDDFYGYDFYANGNNDGERTYDSDPYDEMGHGSHVSGLISAIGFNSIGIIGVAYKANIMAVKVFPADGYTDDCTVSQGIYYAVDNNADVINMSLGGYSPEEEGEGIYGDVIQYAKMNNVPVVVAAGNSNRNAANYSPAKVINAFTTAATDSNDEKAEFSNYGTKIDVCSPGVEVLSLKAEAYNGNGIPYENNYIPLSGTSMASPVAAGVVALIKANNPNFTVEQVRQTLRYAADDKGIPGFDEYFGSGRLNLERALHVHSIPEVNFKNLKLTKEIVQDGSIAINGRIFATQNFDSWDLSYSEVGTNNWITLTSGRGEQNGSINIDRDSPPLFTWDVLNVPDKEYFIQLRGIDRTGTFAQDYRKIEVDNVHISYPDMQTKETIGNENSAIRGFVRIPNLEYYTLSYRKVGYGNVDPKENWREFFRSNNYPEDDVLGVLGVAHLFTPEDRGQYEIKLEARNNIVTIQESTHVIIDPSIKQGWPVRIPQQYAGNDVFFSYLLIPSIYDLDGDNRKEVVIIQGGQPCDFCEEDHNLYGKVYAFSHRGNLQGLSGNWPHVILDYEVDSQDAVFYDIDNNGYNEIFFTVGETDGNWKLYGLDISGNVVSGFPKDFGFNYLGGTANKSLIFKDVTGFNGNGNSKPEFIFAADNYVSILDINGNILEGFPRRLLPEPFNRNIPWLHKTYASPAVADIDGDGYNDVVVTEMSYLEGAEEEMTSQVFVINNKGENIIGWEEPKTVEGTIVSTPAIGDIDSDSYNEIVIIYNYRAWNGVRIAIFEHDGTLSHEREIDFSTSFNNNPLLANLNEDSDLEIVTLDSNRIQVYTNELELIYREYNGDEMIIYNDNFDLQFPRSLDDPITADLDGDDQFEFIFGDNTRINILNYQEGEIDNWDYDARKEGWPRYIIPADLVNDDYRKVTTRSFPYITTLDGDNKLDLIATSMFHGTGKQATDKIFVWEFDIDYNPRTMEWPMFHHDTKHSSFYQVPQIARTPFELVVTRNKDRNLVKGQIIISIIADKDKKDSIRRVEFYVDETKLGEVTHVPFEIMWNPKNRDIKTYKIWALVIDKRYIRYETELLEVK